MNNECCDLSRSLIKTLFILNVFFLNPSPVVSAPEILAGLEYGHGVDWWSLGVIACLMLTGKVRCVLDGFALTMQHSNHGQRLHCCKPDQIRFTHKKNTKIFRKLY